MELTAQDIFVSLSDFLLRKIKQLGSRKRQTSSPFACQLIIIVNKVYFYKGYWFECRKYGVTISSQEKYIGGKKHVNMALQQVV